MLAILKVYISTPEVSGKDRKYTLPLFFIPIKIHININYNWKD